MQQARLSSGLGASSSRALPRVVAVPPYGILSRTTRRGATVVALARSGRTVSGTVVTTTAPADAHAEAVAPSVASSSEEEVGPSLLTGHQKLVLACSSAFALSNIDKTILTLAILPIADEFAWSPTTAGLVQSALFWGFLLGQLPSGTLTTIIGGRRLLPLGVGVWSMATAVVPWVAGSLPAMCTSRAVLGLGESVAPSGIMDILAKSVPADQRATAVSTAFAGLHAGSIVGLVATPAIISAYGWKAVFVLFGVAGLVWCAWFEALISSMARSDPAVVQQLVGSGAIPASAGGAASASATSAAVASTSSAASAQQQQQKGIPWRAFMRARPVQALMVTHFCHNWFHYTMLAWLPTYLVHTLSVDLTHAAHIALLPPIAGIAASALAGQGADRLIAAGVPTATVRKVAQCAAFLGPSAVLTYSCLGEPADGAGLVAAITIALGLTSFSLAGLYCTHQDMSPKYASAMLSLTNTAGSVPGIIGVATVGFLYDHTDSWALSLFAPGMFFMLLGAAVYAKHSCHDPIDFDTADNSPFAWERRLRAMLPHMPRMPRLPSLSGLLGARKGKRRAD